jgi:hypothetical protein
LLIRQPTCSEGFTPLTIPEFVQLVNFRATSKPTPPSSGSKKYTQIITAGQFFLRSFNEEPYTDWPSLYDFRSSGTVTATDTFALDSSIKKVSQQAGDFVRIVHTDDNVSEYDLVSVDRLYENRYNNCVAVAGRNLIFPRAFTADDAQFGGTIVVPSYGYSVWPTDDVTDIVVDDPDWLVLICAAEFVRNDLTRKSEYPNLLGEARERMTKMKENAGARIDEIYRPNFLDGGE